MLILTDGHQTRDSVAVPGTDAGLTEATELNDGDGDGYGDECEVGGPTKPRNRIEATPLSQHWQASEYEPNRLTSGVQGYTEKPTAGASGDNYSILIVTGRGDKAPIRYYGRNFYVKPLEQGFWVLTGFVREHGDMRSHDGDAVGIQAPQYMTSSSKPGRPAPQRHVWSPERQAGHSRRSRGDAVDERSTESDSETSIAGDASSFSDIDWINQGLK
ncbi:hypothetical protein BDY21DRAFT_362433 [Lineolata rhizophorae]|uniref:Uncharacterized protein n=1 Tax=Lineolata rhizophorae TaxID=578093 RepID=A0A6A6P4J8_9PEZI|nr:hypothetical protein BDY21DRAFT_362433 [Lineolata rhizophorae]